ncbi:hypothetical protein HAX54_039553, partial [Datura stramonium]|nr:hypothetical protein [Datura stramonium]
SQDQLEGETTIIQNEGHNREEQQGENGNKDTHKDRGEVKEKQQPEEKQQASPNIRKEEKIIELVILSPRKEYQMVSTGKKDSSPNPLSIIVHEERENEVPDI